MTIWNKILAVFVSIVGLSLLATAPLAKSIPGQYKAEIAQAGKLGRIIYEKDIAAWVGTDKMLEDLGQDVSGLPIRGWVTDKDGSRYRVNFIGVKDGETKIYYQAWTKGKQVKKSKTYKQGIALSDAQMAMWRARNDAMKRLDAGDYLRCSGNYNTVVLPFDAGLYVYLFASTTKANVVVMGGHHRLEYSGNGKAMLNHHAFTNSCVNLLAKGKDNELVEALAITHLNSLFPQEHHVFISKSFSDFPIIVITPNDAVWNVANGTVQYIEQIDIDNEDNSP